MSIGVSLTSWGKAASLALVGYSSSDGITLKIHYGVDVLLQLPALYPTFSFGLVKTKSDLLIDHLRPDQSL